MSRLRPSLIGAIKGKVIMDPILRLDDMPIQADDISTITIRKDKSEVEIVMRPDMGLTISFKYANVSTPKELVQTWLNDERQRG